MSALGHQMNRLPYSDKPDVLPASRKLGIRFVPASFMDVPVRQARGKSARGQTGLIDPTKTQPLDGEGNGSSHALHKAAF